MSTMSIRSWILFVALFYVIDGASIADYTTPCRRNDPNFEKCAISSANEIRPKLKKGIKQLRIPPLDPMTIPKIQIISGGGGPVSIEATFTDIHIEGLSAYELRKFQVDFQNRVIDTEVYIPQLQTKGKYNIKGKVITLPITGSGDSHSKYSGATAIIKLKMKPEIKNGKEYWILDKDDFDLNVQHGEIYLDNLFNGNKQLGDSMNAFINNNWDTVFQELKPTITEAIEALVVDLVSKVFKSFPAEDLFLQ